LTPSVRKNKGEIKVNNIIVADYHFTLTQSLKSETSDPIYKEIYEKIQSLRNKWMQGRLELEEFFKGLQAQSKAIEEYKNKIKSQPADKRIIMVLNKLVNKEILFTPKKLAFRKLSKCLQELLNKNSALITTAEKNMLAEAFLEDLFIEAGDAIKPEMEERVEQLAQKFADSYVANILESHMKKQNEREKNKKDG